MTYNEKEKIFQQVLQEKAVQLLEEVQERDPRLVVKNPKNLIQYTLDEFLFEHRRILTVEELQKGNAIVKALKLVCFVYEKDKHGGVSLI